MRRDDLEAAAAEGLITRDQARRLIEFVAETKRATPSVYLADDESVHFVRGFHDVFLSIGLILLLIGAGYGGLIVAGASGILLTALVAWGLAEVVARKYRLVLPSIVLAIAFTLTAGIGAGPVLWSTPLATPQSLMNGVFPLSLGSVGLIASILFYIRFRLPFALGLAAGSTILLMLAGRHVIIGPGYAPDATTIVLMCGMATFAAAMAYDLSDPSRRTLRSDNAFWLHLLSAPLIVHSVFSIMLPEGRTAMTAGDATVVIATVAALGLVAIIIDRRALFVAGLGYLGFAVSTLIGEHEAGSGAVFAGTLLLLGSVIVALGFGWTNVRRLLLKPLQHTGVARRLPPVAWPAGRNR